jgi:predicted MFS family arabinose efflux permease
MGRRLVTPAGRPYGTLAAFAAFGALWGGWAALVPAVQEAVGASRGELGLALLFVGMGALPAMLVAGPAINRHGARILPLTLAALATTAVLPGLAGSVPALAVGLLALGAASGALDVTINASAADWEARTGGRVMQVAHALFSAGVIAGALAVGLARQAGAGRLACLAGVAVVLAATAVANARQPRTTATRTSARRMRFERRTVALGLACGLAFLVEGGIENWSAIFLERDLDARPAVSALGPATYALAMVAGRLAGHPLSLRFGDRILLGGGSVLAVVGLVLASGAPSVPMALLGFFLGGAGVSAAAPVAFGAAGRGADEAERGSAVATVTTLGYLGFLAGPPITGAAAELVGLRAAFVALACVAAALAVLTPRLPLEGRQTERASAARASSS